MSSLPESEYPNVLIPSDTLEPLITYDAKTASIPPGVKGTRELCISRTSRPAEPSEKTRVLIIVLNLESKALCGRGCQNNIEISLPIFLPEI